MSKLNINNPYALVTPDYDDDPKFEKHVETIVYSGRHGGIYRRDVYAEKGTYGAVAIPQRRSKPIRIEKPKVRSFSLKLDLEEVAEAKAHSSKIRKDLA
jgi:rRNA processing protein Gar1